MAATVCGLSLAVTSCKDDDKDKGNGDGEPTAEEIATDNATTFWGVAANLVSPFDVTVEYEDKTFEPTIGMAENGGTVRQEPKTTANNSIFGSQQYYYYTKSKDFYTPGLTGIFKEPVLIMRLMKVTDNGGTTPNLTAQDGTKLTVVKLVKNPYLYNNNLVPMINWMLRANYQQSLIFLDNQPYQSDYKF